MRSLFAAARKRAGLSQRDLALILGYKKGQVVSNWERGKCEPELTLEQTQRLCEAMGKTLGEMVKLIEED
jgi:transcriptional regulator with XRE-family HTH domain